ncbi:hypothetical protein OPV22_026210 [Ensete ventricosum]|uniref:Uncharacterized protein n=1 Tax=Ensete ventricosum TaxID=4639 RepID=A0AAV8QHH3_ENSVE|nr:hypothetical protein OPV22_026210 [Ensete ventricosum]
MMVPAEVILYPEAILKKIHPGGEITLLSCVIATLPQLKSQFLMSMLKSLGIYIYIPKYGIEEEYTLLLQKDVKWPLGWPVGGFPGPQQSNLKWYMKETIRCSYFVLIRSQSRSERKDPTSPFEVHE